MQVKKKESKPFEARQYDGETKVIGMCKQPDCRMVGTPHVHTPRLHNPLIVQQGDWVVPLEAEHNTAEMIPAAEFEKSYEVLAE